MSDGKSMPGHFMDFPGDQLSDKARAELNVAVDIFPESLIYNCITKEDWPAKLLTGLLVETLLQPPVFLFSLLDIRCRPLLVS